MSAGAVRRSVAGMALAAALAGCFEARGRLHYIGDEKLSYYKDVATEIDYPHLCVPPSDAAIATEAPRRIRHPRKDELWDLTLAEALHLALANNPILRTRGTFLQPGSVLFSNPDLVNSVFDPAIQETGVVFGQRGVEAALSDFDTNFTTSMLWGRNEQVQNNAFEAGGLQPGQTLEEDTANFRARLEKLFAYGGTFGVTNEINYSWNNTPARLFPSVYTGFLRADYRQPLLAGGGLFFNRVAGPDARNPGGIIGVNQGVVIARINTDISIADFEASVRNMLKDVEDLYWELYLAYRTYDAETYARDSALRTWEVVRIRLDIGVGRGDAQARGGAADEAQARDNYFEARARAETALADLYNTETQLRRLIGLPVNDGKVIRPVTEPVVAEYLPDWHLALAEALTRRVELRRQKWNIKSLDLQLEAAKSLVRPRLDLVGNYQVNAFGDDLFSDDDNDEAMTRQGLGSAFETLSQGNQTGWNLGFEFEVPIGLRAAHSQVRHLELRLAKARAVLAAQELEVSHELSVAFQDLDRYYQTAQTNFNRLEAARERVAAFQTQYDLGQTSLDLLLRSQISVAQAQIAYYQSLAQYNQAITDIEFRKGTLLEYDGVMLSEGLWKPEAYRQALQRAWARSHAIDAEPLQHTEPHEFESPAPFGPYNPHSPLPAPEDAGFTPVEFAPFDAEVETAPAPQPETEPEPDLEFAPDPTTPPSPLPPNVPDPSGGEAAPFPMSSGVEPTIDVPVSMPVPRSAPVGVLAEPKQTSADWSAESLEHEFLPPVPVPSARRPQPPLDRDALRLGRQNRAETLDGSR